MRANLLVRSSALAASTERRNFRRALISLSLIAIAALCRAVRAEEGVDAYTGLAVSIAQAAPTVASAE